MGIARVQGAERIVAGYFPCLGAACMIYIGFGKLSSKKTDIFAH